MKEKKRFHNNVPENLQFLYLPCYDNCYMRQRRTGQARVSIGIQQCFPDHRTVLLLRRGLQLGFSEHIARTPEAA